MPVLMLGVPIIWMYSVLFISSELLNKLKYPLAAPSANITTRISPVKKQDVVDEFGKKVKFILDGGQSKIGLESTIINLIGKPQILRLGGLEKNELNKFLKINAKYINKSKDIIMPGQGKLHYSPKIPIRLNVKNPRRHEAFVLIKKRKLSDKKYYYLSKNKNLREAAKNLYAVLRKIKKNNFKGIAIEKIPNKGLGETINDRIIRASKF